MLFRMFFRYTIHPCAGPCAHAPIARAIQSDTTKTITCLPGKSLCWLGAADGRLGFRSPSYEICWTWFHIGKVTAGPWQSKVSIAVLVGSWATLSHVEPPGKNHQAERTSKKAASRTGSGSTWKTCRVHIWLIWRCFIHTNGSQSITNRSMFNTA